MGTAVPARGRPRPPGPGRWGRRRDLSDLEETRGLARDVNRLGRLDAVIHNAGFYTGPHVLPVNVVAPYLLTALIDRPQTGSYPDSKLFVTTLTVAVARRWAEVFSGEGAVGGVEGVCP